MKRGLFVSLSAAALLGLSTAGYGTLYIDGHDKDGNIPKSDCLEMMCEYGCVEEEGTLTGYCCPNDGKNGNECTLNECCSSGSCIGGKCGCKNDADCEGELICLPDKSCGCSSEKTEYIKIDGTIGCCNETKNKLLDVAGGKACCPDALPKWDNIQQKCVRCLHDSDCHDEDNPYCENNICTCLHNGSYVQEKRPAQFTWSCVLPEDGNYVVRWSRYRSSHGYSGCTGAKVITPEGEEIRNLWSANDFGAENNALDKDVVIYNAPKGSVYTLSTGDRPGRPSGCAGEGNWKVTYSIRKQ